MFAVLLALAAPALATIYTTNPVAHTQAYGGQVLRVDWVDDGEAPNLPDIGPCSIDLCIGSETDQRCVQNLGESVDVSATSSISTTIDPSVGENGKYYFIRYRSLGLKEGEYPYQQYSARFHLNSMEGNFDDEVKQLATSSTDDFIWATGTGANASPSGSAAGTTNPGAAGASPSAGASGAGAVAAAPSGSATPSGSGKAVADTASSTSTSTRTSTTATRASASASPSPSADSGVAKFAAPGLFTLAACLAAYIAV
ncbi:hypothetical protein A1Q2_07551 [Trichosporon asahii var. asahii CBS 8904]|uniref:Yeast cell wall synthesis Kre9/Knh1-like N-terminal domain-containing protein n=2 Tax=Trichosporon asahii var. asahii TaxID=189963 RepID=K1VBJ8_TRIAC|nr:hypothetical protein A1Q1_01483 [Trichosporon asahii var. asahii CBS 2479]EJT49388.1 hypothetical protein A1Q1_01483 [Trichosporon asahii var. asahii CBS 2479]EKC98140.1 hypothetical protein A1Q2_07551 [Trichosporon asahii var. asahii CBS 8904]